MSTAVQRIEVFQDTMNWIKSDNALSNSIIKAKKNTEIFWENDYPEVVARAYKVALEEFPKVFKRIEFAVYCSPADDTNYQVFSKMFS